MEKFLRVVVIKEIKGSQYGVQLESAVRDRLAAEDKYEDEEEAALEKVVEFFQSKYFKKDSVITYHFPATSPTAEVIRIRIILWTQNYTKSCIVDNMTIHDNHATTTQ